MTALQERIVTPLVSLLCAVAAASAIDLGVSGGMGTLPPFSYFLVYVALGALPSIGVAVAASLFGWGVEMGLALWAGLSGLAISNPLVALFIAVGTWGLLRRRRSPDPRGVSRGVSTGIAFGAAFFAWPFLHARLPQDLAHSDGFGLLMTGCVFLVAMGLGIAYDRQRASRPGLPPTWALAGLLVLGIAVGPLYLTRYGARSRPPNYETLAAQPERPHVLVLVLDTVRWDHTGWGGYSRDTTPRMLEFAEKSGRARSYPYAFANGSWTIPSHASLLTGLLPSDHQAHMTTVWSTGKTRLTELRAAQTLAEVFRNSGYRTAAVVANGMLFVVPDFRRGFDWWIKPLYFRAPFGVGEVLRETFFPESFANARKPYPGAASINRDILGFFDACLPGPCFVLANYMEAHDPYVPQAKYRGFFGPERAALPPDTKPTVNQSAAELEFLKARYDEEIRSLDEAIGNLLAELDRRSVLDDAWLVITSDHGESFGEHGVAEHGTSVYNEQTRIPLLIQPPVGIELPPLESACSLIDVSATLSLVASDQALGVGRDLRQVNPVEGSAEIEFYGDPRSFRVGSKGALAVQPARAVVSGNMKLIHYDAHSELYDLSEDPQELQRIEPPASHPSFTQIEAQLPPLTPPAESAGASEHRVSPELEADLRTLGYVE